MRDLIKPAERGEVANSIRGNGRDEGDGTRNDARDRDLVDFPNEH